MHFGRYGNIERSGVGGFAQAINPFFLGFETLIRGYAPESFTGEECVAAGGSGQSLIGGCPPFDRLFGQRIGVVNLEARVPLFGVPEYGLINFPFIPTELSAFIDGGVAWDADNPVDLQFSRSSLGRVPVFSTGVSARMNILGAIILEAYYAYPFQRPDKGAHWGFNIAPGW
jgi:outer membrane protein assembly factor BamA